MKLFFNALYRHLFFTQLTMWLYHIWLHLTKSCMDYDTISLRVCPQSSIMNIGKNTLNIFEFIRIGPRWGLNSGYLIISLYSSLLYKLCHLARFFQNCCIQNYLKLIFPFIWSNPSFCLLFNDKTVFKKLMILFFMSSIFLLKSCVEGNSLDTSSKQANPFRHERLFWGI